MEFPCIYYTIKYHFTLYIKHILVIQQILVTLTDEGDFTGADNFKLKDANGEALAENDKVKTADLAKVTKIDLEGLNGEVKGLEYFTGLKEFNDYKATAITNRALDFSANTKLTKLALKKSNGVATLVLPEVFVDEDEEKTYLLEQFILENTKLTSLDLSAYTELVRVEVKGNKTLRNIDLAKGTTVKKSHVYTTLDLSGNSLEEIDLEYCAFPNGLTLSDNRLGVLDLGKTTIGGTLTAEDQVFYVSEDLAKINFKDTFENIDTHDFTVQGTNVEYDEKTGELKLDGVTGYTYTTKDNGKTKRELKVTITPANPMNRLYNPNSGEHFYTADIKEKEALVALGWNDEGYGWVAPTEAEGKAATNTEVYRLYNPNAGDHHYTMDEYERDTLVSYGWKDENVGWYSATGDVVEVYRQYNPNAKGAGSHNYTTDKAENDYLVSVGWVAEGAGWNAKR